MKEPQDLQAGLEQLYRRRAFGIKPGLAVVRRLCELVGNPQTAFASIHIAGTNGKGSTAAMIEAVLRTAGIRTGLYTSPHLMRFQERIRLAGAEVPDDMLLDALHRCEVAADRLQSDVGHAATFFEVSTVMAFLCFQAAGVRLAVVETGLGGRLDATNVVQPLLSVITRIGMDHEAYLGNTLAQIAREKAGIIKAGCPVVSGPQATEAEAVLRSVAEEAGSPLLLAPDAVSVHGLERIDRGQKVRVATQGEWSGTVVLPLEGQHQIENLGIALAALEQVCGRLGVSIPMPVVRQGLASVCWRGRCEILQEQPLVIADAAHNPAGTQALVQMLRKRGHQHIVLVTAMCHDKHIDGVVQAWGAMPRRVVCVPMQEDRGMPPEDLANVYRRHGRAAQAYADVGAGLAAAEDEARQASLPVVVAGSIFLLGEVLPLFPTAS